MGWTWRTRGDGVVEVDRGQGFEALELLKSDRSTERTEQWVALAAKHGAVFDVPLSWVLAVIYSESGGNPRATNAAPDGPCGPRGCNGLMAIHGGIFTEHTPEEWKDPDTNVRKGCELLGGYRAKGFDLPAVASMYNAGPSAKTGGAKQSTKSPWGMVENMPAVPWSGYIEKVVRASNWWRRRELAGELPGAPPPKARSRRLAPLLMLAAALAAAASSRR